MSASLAKLGIGTAALGLPYGIGAERVSTDSAVALLRDAVAAGVRYVDTAASYGDAESVVGKTAAQLVSAGVRVCTKITVPALRARGALPALRESLVRLGLERVDTVMLHSADTAALRDPAIGTELGQLVSERLTARVGVSTYGSADAVFASELDWVRALQVEHSVLNPSVVQALGAKPRIEVVARSVLCKGLLTSRRMRAGAVGATLRGTLDGLEKIARECGLDLPTLAIRFALDSPGVDVVLVGVSDATELETALRAATRPPLDAAVLHELAAFDRSQSSASHPELWPAQRAGGADS